MNTDITIIHHGPPQPKLRARHRNVKTKAGKEFVSSYTPTKTRKAEQALAVTALQKMSETGFQRIEGQALRVSIVFYMPIPASTTKRNRLAWADELVPHTKKPDLDNLIKLVLDALNGVVYADDNLVSALWGVKVYSPSPRTEITISMA